jgi:hypothetical protein
MRQKRPNDGNGNQVIPAISITFPDNSHCAMRDILNLHSQSADEVEEENGYLSEKATCWRWWAVTGSGSKRGSAASGNR